MSELQEFLNVNTVSTEEKIIIGERFKSKDGKPLKFTIKGISDSKYSEIEKLCTKRIKKGIDFDSARFKRLIAIEGTIDPSFTDSKSIKAVGLNLPEEYISKVLKPGEITILSERILELSGFSDMDALIDEAKK